MAINKNKWLTALVLLLVLGNLASLAYLWIGRGRQAPPPQPARADAFIIRELQLDATQQQQYRRLVEEHRRRTQDIRANIRAAKDEFFGLLQDTATTDSAKTAAAARISRFTEELDLVTFQHFQQVRAICTPQQQQHFDEIIRKVIGMMAGGPQGSPQGRREGPPQGPPPQPPPGE